MDREPQSPSALADASRRSREGLLPPAPAPAPLAAPAPAPAPPLGAALLVPIAGGLVLPSPAPLLLGAAVLAPIAGGLLPAPLLVDVILPGPLSWQSLHLAHCGFASTSALLSHIPRGQCGPQPELIASARTAFLESGGGGLFLAPPFSAILAKPSPERHGAAFWKPKDQRTQDPHAPTPILNTRGAHNASAVHAQRKLALRPNPGAHTFHSLFHNGRTPRGCGCRHCHFNRVDSRETIPRGRCSIALIPSASLR